MNFSRLILIALILFSFAGSYAFQQWQSKDGSSQVNPGPRERDSTSNAKKRMPYRRIISLAPSTTEVLFAVGLGKATLGVTRYCDYPPEARNRVDVGGYYDPSYETILTLNSDLVVTLPEHTKVREHLHTLGLRTLTVNHRSISGILDSITVLGKAGGVERKADALLKALQSRMEKIRKKSAKGKRPRVLVSIGRIVKDGSIRRITVCGPNSYYNDLIQGAGGVNAYTGVVGYPRVSGEGILEMDPDVIVDLVSDMEEKGLDEETIRREWAAIPNLTAVRNRRVFVFGGDHLTVPGPRFILLLESMARALHPEADQK